MAQQQQPPPPTTPDALAADAILEPIVPPRDYLSPTIGAKVGSTTPSGAGAEVREATDRGSSSTPAQLIALLRASCTAGTSRGSDTSGKGDVDDDAAALVESCCEQLYAMVCSVDARARSREQLCKACALVPVVAAVRAHPMSAPVQRGGLAVLYTLAYGEDAQVDAVFRGGDSSGGSGGVVELAMAAVRNHRGNAAVLTPALTLLRNLANGHTGRLAAVFAVGVADAALAALAAHRTSVEVQVQGLALLRNLSNGHEGRKAALFRAGAASAALAALGRGAAEPAAAAAAAAVDDDGAAATAATQALALLRNLSAGEEGREAAVFDAGAPHFVLAALEMVSALGGHCRGLCASRACVAQADRLSAEGVGAIERAQRPCIWLVQRAVWTDQPTGCGRAGGRAGGWCAPNLIRVCACPVPMNAWHGMAAWHPVSISVVADLPLLPLLPSSSSPSSSPSSSSSSSWLMAHGSSPCSAPGPGAGADAWVGGAVEPCLPEPRAGRCHPQRAGGARGCPAGAGGPPA
jgi:hypothetical protein